MQTKLKAIRQEFGEPFRDVVHGFAVMGYSKRATSEILGWHRQTFLTYCQRYAPDAPWKPQRDQRRECRGQGKGWPKGKRREKPLKYTDGELLAILRKYPDLTYCQFSNLAPVAASTIARRFGTWNRARELSAETEKHG